jgi:predicted deacetylase
VPDYEAQSGQCVNGSDAIGSCREETWQIKEQVRAATWVANQRTSDYAVEARERSRDEIRVNELFPVC